MNQNLVKIILLILNSISKINFILLISLILSFVVSRVLMIDVKVVQKIYYLFPISLIIFLFENNFRYYIKNKKILLKNLIINIILIVLIVSPLSYIFSKNSHSLINNILLVLGVIFVYFFNFKMKPIKESAESNNEKFILSSLLILFVVIKLPLLNKSFTGNNTIKYNAYVEPAIHMVKNNSPFVVNIKYLANPITHRDGINRQLIGIPTMEWFLALTYKIFGLENIEVKTRLATSLIGFIVLILSYKVIKKIANKIVAFFFLLLLVTNPLFILITQLTVYDSIILLFFLASLLFFLKYENNNKKKFLIYSSLYFSAAFLSKEVALLWGLPFFILYIVLKNKKNFIKTISESILFLLFLAIPMVFFKIWVAALSYGNTVSLLIPIALVVFIYICVKKVESMWKGISFIAELLVKNKYILFFIILSIGFISIFIFKSKISNWSEFITDREIIFYWPMYEYILKSRQIFYISQVLFITFLLGFFAIFKNKPIDKKFKNFMISFGLGLFVYLVLASKAIFFHNYYNINFIYIYLLGSAYFLYIVTKNLSFNTKIIFIAILSALIYKNNLNVREELLLREKNGFEELSAYMIKNNEPDNFYIDNDNTLSLSITTRMPRITNLNYEAIQSDIRKIGFSATMKKYKIKYLVSSQAIDYKKYAPAFTSMNLEKLESNDRTDLIFIKFGESNQKKYSEEVLQKALELEKLNLFDLEAEIGDYKVYNLWNYQDSYEQNL